MVWLLQGNCLHKITAEGYTYLRGSVLAPAGLRATIIYYMRLTQDHRRRTTDDSRCLVCVSLIYLDTKQVTSL